MPDSNSTTPKTSSALPHQRPSKRPSQRKASKVQQALAPDDIQVHKKLDRALTLRIWDYVAPYRMTMLATLLLTVGAGGLRIVMPLLARRIIDVEIQNSDTHGLVRMSMLYLVVLLGAVAMDVYFNYLTSLVGQRSMDDMRRKMFRHVVRLDVSFFDRNPVGRLITRMTSDVSTLNDLLSSGIVTVLGECIMLVGVFVVMLIANFKLTMVAMVSAPFIILVVGFFRRHARKWYLETRRCLAIMNAYLQENVSGMRTVQSFSREPRNQRQFDALNLDHRDSNIHTILAYAIFYPAMTFIASFALAGVIWVGGRDLIHGRLLGEATMTFGQLFMFIQYMQMLFSPIRDLSEKYNLLQAAMASSERIFTLLDTEPKIVEAAAPKPIEGLRDAIRFEEVEFSYLPDEPVLKGVSFDIKRGQTVAVVGATGAGKSTLINLLTRFYDVNGGRITIDGTDVRELKLADLRRLYAIVLQDVFLFSGTIADNLRLANPALADDQLWNVLREVHANDFVEALPGGINAVVTERGGTFSTGQKQLLAFARALAADPQVLILDEATANIDTATEQRIQEATQRILAGRTGLVIAHRLSTIRRADCILVMHHGRIAEFGPHDELMQRDGLYRRLYDLQYRGEAGDDAEAVDAVLDAAAARSEESTAS